jgi:hypothetical protein
MKEEGGREGEKEGKMKRTKREEKRISYSHLFLLY